MDDKKRFRFSHCSLAYGHRKLLSLFAHDLVDNHFFERVADEIVVCDEGTILSETEDQGISTACIST
jgi:hypothetical protein